MSIHTYTDTQAHRHIYVQSEGDPRGGMSFLPPVLSTPHFRRLAQPKAAQIWRMGLSKLAKLSVHGILAMDASCWLLVDNIVIIPGFTACTGIAQAIQRSSKGMSCKQDTWLMLIGGVALTYTNMWNGDCDYPNVGNAVSGHWSVHPTVLFWTNHWGNQKQLA